MADYLLTESQGPWAGPGADRFAEDAVALRAAGHRVVLFLVENGVVAALPSGPSALHTLLERGGEVWVDGFSLAHRALTADQLLDGARLVEMADVAERLLEPQVRGVWH
ncbi:DsrE family protein [Streptomyces sp. Y1]|uniref:DsrE family protein n=1 Tax=Streptomyces sp. Y1 TaxID=3238634 RepID=A0AB39TDM0_9ACTN